MLTSLQSNWKWKGAHTHVCVCVCMGMCASIDTFKGEQRPLQWAERCSFISGVDLLEEAVGVMTPKGARKAVDARRQLPIYTNSTVNHTQIKLFWINDHIQQQLFKRILMNTLNLSQMCLHTRLTWWLTMIQIRKNTQHRTNTHA